MTEKQIHDQFEVLEKLCTNQKRMIEGFDHINVYQDQAPFYETAVILNVFDDHSRKIKRSRIDQIDELVDDLY